MKATESDKAIDALYDEECGVFFSFSTKQEFVEAVGEEFFINEIRNRK